MPRGVQSASAFSGNVFASRTARYTSAFFTKRSRLRQMAFRGAVFGVIFRSGESAGRARMAFAEQGTEKVRSRMVSRSIRQREELRAQQVAHR